MSLVVKHFYVSPTPNQAGNYVEIVARQAGLLGWIFSIFKIDPPYRMNLSYDELIHESTSFSGFRKSVVTTGSLSSSFYGYHKPYSSAISIFSMFLLIAYSFEGLVSNSTNLFICIMGGLIAVAYYILNKELMIGVSELNAKNYILTIKRSVIEGREITEDDLMLVVEIITTVLRENRNLASSNT